MEYSLRLWTEHDSHRPCAQQHACSILKAFNSLSSFYQGGCKPIWQVQSAWKQPSMRHFAAGKTALGDHLLPAMRNMVIAARAMEASKFPFSAGLLAGKKPAMLVLNNPSTA